MACPARHRWRHTALEAELEACRDRVCRVSAREETVVQGDNSHGSDTGLGCRQRNTNTGWTLEDPTARSGHACRASHLITKQGTTAKARERDLLFCGFAMAHVSGSGRRNLEHFTAWHVCTVGRSSADAALLRQSEVFRYDGPACSALALQQRRALDCVGMSVGMRGDGIYSTAQY